MTTYDLFVHYYNDTIGKAVTNLVDCKWYPADTTIGQYTGDETNQDADKYLSVNYLLGENPKSSKYYKQEETLEHVYISPISSNSNDNTDIYQKLIIDSSTIQNPKYDMIFVWDGLGYYTSQQVDKNGHVESQVQLYYDKMKRISFRPWFFHSVYHSLTAIMTTAQKLVDLFGKDHVMMGKEVNLKQYIEIV